MCQSMCPKILIIFKTKNSLSPNSSCLIVCILDLSQKKISTKFSVIFRMLPGDSKSQNSDYGSFCHTPSDTFGHLQASGDTPDSSRPMTRSNPEEEPDSGGDHHNHHHQDTQRQPLLPPDMQDSSSEDDAGANSSGYTRRKTKLHRYYFYVIQTLFCFINCIVSLW